jgi:hypothetical protein
MTRRSPLGYFKTSPHLRSPGIGFCVSRSANLGIVTPQTLLPPWQTGSQKDDENLLKRLPVPV